MNGIIFDIKEFSIHDGPGGRFTVFLKGCPLRCLWCHNPEGLSKDTQLLYKKNMCVGCGRCLIPCEHEECKGFGRCVHACANGCLSVSGREISAEALAQLLFENKDFFEMANGGVTLSGGEPLMQSEFVCELADKLKGIHKAIQTSGYASNEIYKKTIDKFDYVMQDIKLWNRGAHKKYTGVYNDVILENIEYLKKSGKKFIFRVPLIPDITDTKENLKGIAEITEDYPVELLPYNVMAGAKYEMLGMDYKLSDRKNKNADFTSFFKNAILK